MRLGVDSSERNKGNTAGIKETDMEIKLGDVIYNPNDARCKDLLGKLVMASNYGVKISENIELTDMGTLMEVRTTDTDRPFRVSVSGTELSFTFIREMVKSNGEPS